MYSHEAQYITCVALAPVKRGIFMVSVKYVLVVCTNVEITLVGVCFSNGRSDGQVRSQPSTSGPTSLLQQAGLVPPQMAWSLHSHVP